MEKEKFIVVHDIYGNNNERIIDPYSIKVGDILYSIQEDNSEFGYTLKEVEITGITITKTKTEVKTASEEQYFALSEDGKYFERYTKGLLSRDFSKLEERWFVDKCFVKSELKRILQQKLDCINKDIVSLVFRSREISQRIEVLDSLFEKGGNNEK